MTRIKRHSSRAGGARGAGLQVGQRVKKGGRVGREEEGGVVEEGA